MLSVVIPTKNHSQYLEGLLPLLLESGIDIESVLVCNDASTDNTRSLLERYKSDRRLFVLENRESIGGIASIAMLYKYVKTPYVMFMSSDDYIIPENITRLLHEIKITKSALAFGKYLIDNNNEKLKLNHPGWLARNRIENSDFSSLLAFDHYIFFAATIFECESLPVDLGRLNPFEESFNRLTMFDKLGEFRAHDWNLALEVARNHGNRIHFMDEDCAVFRKVPNQLSSDNIYLHTGRASFEMSLLIIKYLSDYETRIKFLDNRFCAERCKLLLNSKVNGVVDKSSEFFLKGYLPMIRAAYALLSS